MRSPSGTWKMLFEHLHSQRSSNSQRLTLQQDFLRALAAGADQAHLFQRAVGDELVRHRLLAPDIYLAASEGTRAVVELRVELEPEPQAPSDTPVEAAGHLLEVLNETHRMTLVESQELQALIRSALMRAARIPKR